MNSESFRNKIDSFNRDYVSSVTGVPSNSAQGVDLLGDIAIEIKARLNTLWPSYSIHENQFQKYKKYDLFYAFILYGLKKPVFQIRKNANLANWITTRDTYFVPGSFLNDKEVHDTKTGPYRYVHIRDFEKADLEKISYGQDNLFVPLELKERVLDNILLF